MDSSKPEISIIVPIYNVEKYLSQCLESVMNQTFKDWECILVNDCTPDNSAAIMEEFARRDPRFKVLHREKNGGLSAARNSGLNIAQGKYIGFMDADDWAEPQLYQELYDLIKQHDADMSQVGFFKEYQGMLHKKRLVKGLTIWNKGEIVREAFYDKSLPNYMWNKLFRHEVITHPFPEGKVFEDIYTLSYWLKNIRKGVSSPTMLYHYRFRKGSIANTKSISFRLNFFEAWIERMHQLDGIGGDVINPQERSAMLWRCALSCAKIASRMVKVPKEDRMEALYYIKEMCEKNLLPPDKKYLGKSKYKAVQRLCTNPRSFIFRANLAYMFDLHSKYRNSRAYD